MLFAHSPGRLVSCKQVHSQVFRSRCFRSFVSASHLSFSPAFISQAKHSRDSVPRTHPAAKSCSRHGFHRQRRHVSAREG